MVKAKDTSIHHFLLLAILAMTSLSLTAAEKISKTLMVDGESTVKVKFKRGDITLIGWDQNKIDIKGVLDSKVKKLVTKKKGKQILIDIILLDKNSYMSSGKGSHLTIKLPKELLLEIKAVTGSVNISNMNAAIKLHLESGNITAKDIKKAIKISSVGSNINLINIDAAVDINSVSGKIMVKGSSPKLFIKSVYSNIEVSLSAIRFCKISNVSGNINLFGPLANNGEISINNTTGNSFYFVNSELNAQIRLETGPGGEILNQLTKDKPTSGMTGDEKLIYSVGDASGKVVMTTQSGKLIVKKAAQKRSK